MKPDAADADVVPAVAVVQAKPDPSPEEDVPERDTSNDGCLTPFVVFLVKAPCVIIGITVGISVFIAMLTIILASRKEAGDIFADGGGGFEQGHETFLMARARNEAMDEHWPYIESCGRKGGFRRLADGGMGAVTKKAKKQPAHTGMRSLLNGQAEEMISSAGFYSMSDIPDFLTPPQNRPPLDREPIAWEAGDVVWESTESARRRRMDDDDDGGGDPCEEDLVVLNSTLENGNTCSHASPCACDQWSTGGCNTVCTPGADSKCDAQQRTNNHVFIMIAEAKTPCPVEDAETDASGKSCDEDGANAIDCGLTCPGADSFNPQNIQEIKRLEDLVHDDPEFNEFCFIDPNGKCLFDPAACTCSRLTTVVNYFYPRAKPTGTQLYAEAMMAMATCEPMMVLQSDAGCLFQWFLYDLYQGNPQYTWVLFAMINVLFGGEAGCGSGVANATDTGGLSPELFYSALLNSGVDDIYGALGCPLMGATQQGCSQQPGCVWQAPVSGGNGTCIVDAGPATHANEFAELMCFSDGTGSAVPSFPARSQDLANFHAQDHLKPFLDYFFDKRFSPTNPKSKFTRAFMRFGGPLRGYKSRDDGELPNGKNEQDLKLIDWFQVSATESNYEPADYSADRHGPLRSTLPSGGGLREQFAEKAEDSPDVELTYLLSVVLFDEIIALLVGDALLGVISFLVVGFYMWFQTGSLWISMFGMMEISISLPISYFFYTYVFQIQYFDFLCSLSLYIVMAIGADDVFIWFDAYKQSAYEPPHISGSLETRFIWAWHKAASAMLVTSLTTCAVFCATATSPLLNIMSFGFFTSMVIFLDYIYVITWLPAATVLYNKWFENQGFARCTCCCVSDQTEETEQQMPKGKAVAVSFGIATPIALIFSGYFFWLGSSDSIYAKAYGIGALVFFILFFGISSRIFATIIKSGSDGRAMQEFFEGPFTEFITAEKVRKGLLGGMMVLLIPLVICSFLVGPATKEEQFLPDDHPLQKVVTVMNNEFPVSGRDEKIRVSMMFGITGYDRKDESPLFDYKTNKQEESAAAAALADSDKPHVVYYDAFDWTIPATQSFLLAQCVDLDSRPFVAADRAPDCEEEPCAQEKTACVVAELGAWLTRSCAGDDPDCRSAGDMIASDDPLDRNSSTSYLNDYGINGSAFDTSFAAGLPPAKANRILWDFYKEVWSKKVVQGVGFVNSEDPDSKVKYVFMEFSVPMKRRAYYTPDQFSNMYTQCKDWANNVVAPTHVGKPAMTDTMRKWMWMNTQKLYLTYALWGILIAVLLAFVVLCVATNNLIISLLACVTIFSVVACVVGCMYLAGWELGNIESICLTILAGFCVDYIVHLAHSYVESPDSSSRLIRVEYAVGHMGISVLSGALTSLGASFLLFWCTLQFFSSFGAFFFGTIFLAWVWANFFFVPALGTFGPENNYMDFYGFMFGPTADAEVKPEVVTDNPVLTEDGEEGED